MTQYFGMADTIHRFIVLPDTNVLGWQDTVLALGAHTKRSFVALVEQYPLWLVSGILCALLMLVALRRIKTRKRERNDVQRTLDALPDAVALFNPDGKLMAVNRKLSELMPLKLDRSVYARTKAKDLYAQISADNVEVERARTRARETSGDLDSTITFELPSYDQRSLTVKEKPTVDGGIAVSVYGSAMKMDKRLFDTLTGLPNRVRLVHELAQRCSRTKNELALIILDLRSFRQINDTYGRDAGDELLRQTAKCLRASMPSNALIARTAGDEFAVLLESNTGHNAVEEYAKQMLLKLRNGLNVNDMNVPVRASVGIAYAPEHGNTVSSLLTCADSACAHAKHISDNTLVVYNSIQQQQAKHLHQLEVGLQKAIERRELVLQYQPQVDIKTKMTSGMEALIRWNSEEFGSVSPSEFIPVAEKTGIINQLGNWVLYQAVSDYQRLATFGMSPAVLSVNLSRKQFEDGRIVSDVSKLLTHTGFDPSKLCFEITETALSSDTEHLHKQLLDLTSLGVRLAIDDFGVGYSSLRELRDFPISEVKIDRAFISDIATDQHSQDIVAAIVDISRSLGADVVAEGIENRQQFDKIAELGCDRAQGFYLCEPMAATTFPDVVLGA